MVNRRRGDRHRLRRVATVAAALTAGTVIAPSPVDSTGSTPNTSPPADVSPSSVSPSSVSPSSVTHFEPYSWGSIYNGTGAYLSWGSTVRGDGTLSTTRPSGGGSLGAAVDTGGPDSKLTDLIAFGGGEVIAFAEGSSTYSNTAHMIAVVESGSGSGAHELWAWGNNSYGQLGNGTRTATQTPTRVVWTPAAGERVVAVDVGEGHSLMLTDTAGVRTVYAWGRNQHGQLGIAAVAMGSSGMQTTPRVVPTLSGEGIVDIAAGRFHSAAVDDDGHAWVWGYDAATNVTAYGDLGVSGTLSRPVPVRLTDDTLLRRRATPTTYSVTSNVVTVTTSDRNFFDIGNTVATTGTGIAILDQTAALTKVSTTTYSHTAQPNVASTPASGTISLTNAAATPSDASITTNTARLTVATGHDIRIGNRIRVAVGDPAFDGDRVVTGRGTDHITYVSQPDTASTPAPAGSISIDTGAVTPTAASITSNSARLTVTSGHDIGAGNRVRIAIGDPAFDGDRIVTGRGTDHITVQSQPDVATTTAPSGMTATHTATAPVAVTSRSLSSNKVSLTVTAGHPFKVGSRILVATGDATFDGQHTVTELSGTTIVRYAKTAANVAATATTGTVTLVDQSVGITSYSISNNTATVTADPAGPTHNVRVGNTITVAGFGGNLDGTKTVTAATATTFSFIAEADRAATTVTGTVDVLDRTGTTSDYTITNNTATVTVGAGHRFAVGNRITVAGMGGIGGNLDGPTTITAIGASTISFPVEENRASVPVTGTIEILDGTDTVTAYSITSNTATLTITNGHSFEVGNQILVTGIGGLDGNLDGLKTITGVTATGVQFTAQPNVPATTITGGSPEAVVTDCTSACPSAPTGLVEIAAGSAFTMARTTSGTVVTWGYTHSDNYGRLGRSGNNRPAPVVLPAGCVAARLDASPYNGAVVCADNRIATWGYHVYGNLGTDVTPTSVTTPALVVGISLGAGETIVDIDAAAAGMTALTSTGRVFAWGRGTYLRNGTTSTANLKSAVLATRVDPPTGDTPVALFSNYYTSGIADSSGAAWTWGYGRGAGLQGQGVAMPDTARFARIGVDPATRIDRIDTTYYATVALLSDGSLWSWGSNGATSGRYFLGDGLTTGRLTPARLALPVGLDTSLPTHRVTGLDCAYMHCLITTSNGSIYGWGDGSSRQLTPGSTTTTASDRTTPTLITSGLTAPIVAAGYGYSLYADIGANGTGGRLYAWGSNAYRRASPTVSTSSLTAFNEVKDMSVPASPGTVTDVIAVAAGNEHTVALRADGTLMAWGRNAVGQLGIGSTTSTVYYSEPVLSGGRTAASLHVEGDHVLVRATDGTLHGWGRNTNGVLGDGTVTNRLTPTHVAVGHTFTRIDTSGHPTVKQVQTTVGITTDGTVLAWGSNSYGQLGRPDRPASTNGYSAIPVVVQTTAGANLPGTAGVDPPDAVVTGGAWSAAHHRLRTDLPPSEPLSPAATSPASGTIAVTWTAPTSPRRLLGYVVTVSRGGSVVFTAGAGAAATSVTLAAPTVDIVNGVVHTITVSAVNDAGTSAPSTPVTVTPTGLPSIVQNLTIDIVADGLDVGFDLPADDGGQAILDYTVASMPVGTGSSVIVTVPAGATRRTGEVRFTDGLLPDVEYTVAVTARNANGTGPAATSSIVIPGRPSAPTITAAVGRDTAAEITFTPAADDGGAAILSHVVTLYASGTTTVVANAVVPAGTAVATITGLTNGTTYDVVVRASQAADGLSLLGAPSTTVPVTVGRPAAPTGVTATPTASGTLTVTWNAVADLPGIAVTGYESRTTIGSTVGAAVTRTCTGTPCSAAISPLTNGTPATIEMRALSTGGAGPWSSAVTATPRTVPGAPASLDLTPTDRTASIGFEPPTDTGGDPIDAYIVTVTPTAGGATVWTGTLTSIETFTAVDGLTNGTSYTVAVQARNGAGLSAARTGTVIPATVPGAPSNIRVRPGSIIVAWDAPTDTGGDPIARYEITVTDTDGISTTVETAAGNPDCNTGTRYCEIDRVYTAASSVLDPPLLTVIPADMEYTVEVAAVNSQGSGEPGLGGVIVSSQPSEPLSPTVVNGVVSAAVCWTAPTTVPTGRTITQYRLRFTVGSAQNTATVAVADLAPAAACTAPSVGHSVTAFDDGSAPVAGVTYTVTIAASASTEDHVYGLDSTTVTALPYDVPGAAPSVGATPTGTTALVSWTAAVDNGETIDAYTVTAEPGGATCSWTSGSGPLECTVVGLADGVDHTFSVLATNDAGDGPVRRSASVRIDATGPSASWSLLGWDDSSTARLRVTFDEAMSGFAVGDVTGVTGCTITLAAVTGMTADLTLVCPDGDVTPVLGAGSVSDGVGNVGPAGAVTGPTLTFSTPTTTVPVTTVPGTTVPGTTVPVTSTTTTTTAPTTTATTVPGTTVADTDDPGGVIGFAPAGAGGDAGPVVVELPATGADARSAVTRAMWVIVFGLALLALRRTMCTRAR